MSSKRITIIVASILILIIALYVLIDRRAKEETELSSDVATSTSVASTTVLNLGEGLTATLPSGYQVERVEETVQTVPKAPSLSRPIVFDPAINASVREAIEKKVKELTLGLSQNSRQFAYWIDLGTYHKVAGDFEGAKIYWDYAGKLAPKNFVSFGNLGDLYAYYVKDNAMAETSYKKAIANDPTQEYLYAQLAHVYIDVFKDESKAKAILDQGLLKLPGNQNLLQLKASLK